MEAVYDSCSSTPSAETEARATHRQRALLIERFFLFCCPVRLCGLCVPRALSDSGGARGGGAPPGTATAATGSREVQQRASGAASALLPAESEPWAIQGGDTKSLPNHLLSPALRSTASRAKSALGHALCWLLLFQCSCQVAEVPLIKETTSFFDLNIWIMVHVFIERV